MGARWLKKASFTEIPLWGSCWCLIWQTGGSFAFLKLLVAPWCSFRPVRQPAYFGLYLLFSNSPALTSRLTLARQGVSPLCTTTLWPRRTGRPLSLISHTHSFHTHQEERQPGDRVMDRQRGISPEAKWDQEKFGVALPLPVMVRNIFFWKAPQSICLHIYVYLEITYIQMYIKYKCIARNIFTTRT